MPSQSPNDRQRTRNDLRELAKLARPGASSVGHGFDTADSSGYVDLSSYSARDAGWVNRELARAKKGAPPPLPGAARKIDSAMPRSMAPVAMEAFLAPDATAKLRPSTGKKVLFTMLGLASVGVVGFLAVTLARHPPPAPTTSPASVVAAPPPSTETAAASQTTAADAPAPVAASTTSAATSSPPVATTAPAVATTAPAAKKKSATASHAHAVAAVAAPAPSPVAATHPAPAARPAAHASSGGDSLMDLIKKSVATGK